MPSCFDLIYNFFGFSHRVPVEVTTPPDRNYFELFVPPSQYEHLSDFYVFVREVSCDIATLLFTTDSQKLMPSKFESAVMRLLIELMLLASKGPVVFRLKELFPHGFVIDLSEKLQYVPNVASKADCIALLSRVDLADLTRHIMGLYSTLIKPPFILELNEVYTKLYFFICDCYRETGQLRPDISLEPTLENLAVLERCFHFFKSHYPRERGGFSAKTVSCFLQEVAYLQRMMGDRMRLKSFRLAEECHLLKNC